MAGQESVPVRTHSVGDQYIYSCLSVAAVGLVLGLDLTSIVRGIEATPPIPGRLERIECGQQFGVFVDQALSPATLAACLHALRQVTTGRLICVDEANPRCSIAFVKCKSCSAVVSYKIESCAVCLRRFSKTSTSST